MPHNCINLVWLKRDIRSQDHQPLQRAEESGLPYVIFFCFEPSLIVYPDTSLRHLQFQYHAIVALNQVLANHRQEVIIFHTEVLTALQHLQKNYAIANIFSYQESGIQRTYERDKAVAKFCTQHNICWQQFQRDGIIRGIKNRKEWDKQWLATMNAPLITNTFANRQVVKLENPYPIAAELLEQLKDYPAHYQPAGEKYAFKYLQSFIAERGKNYSKHISKPLESRTSCGRISPYLSWGNISVRQAYQFVRKNTQKHPHQTHFNNFLIRLKWHCHFIQKFEVECSYENQCVNAGYELLERTKNESFIRAWQQGQTGFPLVDACMKCLQQTGWINFRMRAMLVSFLCHHLYQDWRDGVYHLARLFLDYEPGIHYPQFQMQAGTTGINTIRMYNPIKQSEEHDPEGVFIRKWLPVLQKVPNQFIHEPYKMSQMEQQLYNLIIGKDYPAPVCNISLASKEARNKLWGHRSHPLVQQENKRILQTHTRTKKHDIQPT